MRKIKFRAWHKRYKAMVHWKLFVDLSEGLKIAVTDAMLHKVNDRGGTEQEFSSLANYQAYEKINIFEHPDFIVMQFTGLLDKNGKEIYEGDIVIDIFKEKLKVEWNHGSYRLKRGGQDYAPLDLVDNEVEVIGNIYENPVDLKKRGE